MNFVTKVWSDTIHVGVAHMNQILKYLDATTNQDAMERGAMQG